MKMMKKNGRIFLDCCVPKVVEQLDMTRELTDDELYASIDEVLMMPQYRKQFSVRVFDAAKTGIV